MHLPPGPHVESLSVTFSGEAVWPGEEFRRLLIERIPYRILAAEFQPARGPGLTGSNVMLDRGWYNEGWKVTVYPVLCEYRHLANLLLQEQGLPALARWLGSSGNAGWGAKSQCVALVFGPSDGSLAVRESSGV